MEDLGDVVRDKSQMGGEVVHLHLWQLPARKVAVPAVVKGHIIAYRFRQWGEQVADAGRGLYITVKVSVEYDPCIG
ncbi:hypothetical protein ES703_36620 [subsurface metagenome]